MKKKILLIITFMMITFIPNIKAEGNMKVIFNTSFEDQINIEKIEKIFIMMDDIQQKDYDIVLEYKDNFHLEMDNIPKGDVIINSITVSQDYTADYDYQYAITKTSEEEVNIAILVTKVSKDPNRKKAQVTYEYIAEVLGYDPLKIANNNMSNKTTGSSNNSTTTSSSDNSDEPVVITSSVPTQATKSEREIKEEEEQKKENEKKEEQQKRKSIYLIILLIFIATIIIIGVIVGIKIANANK